MDDKTRKKSVAIVGLSGRFPNSENLNIFWENLKQGKSLYNWYSDEELRNDGIKESHLQDETFIKIDTTVESAKTFDPAFFEYTTNEAKYMDPQTRILHEEVWLALEDAKCNPLTYSKKIGLIVSASENLDWKVYAQNAQNSNVSDYYRRQISNVKFSNTLISYKLNLKGPSYFVDTACSSSLTSIHMATRQLLMKEASMYVVSSISLNSRSSKGYFYQEGMISSKDGICKPFDKDASGTFLGEGSGTVVLKRLEDAIKDGDTIYGVIRGSATNNDGNDKVGYTAPSIEGQASCISLAHKIANVSPNTIGYVEAHGTATQIGDSIELEALNIAFKKDKNNQCAIGSIKSNLGHLDAAAGMAGFIKTTLALHHKQIPPSLHYEKANPKINFENGPFYVNTALKTYDRLKEDTPLRAGVSSFGIGGTNAHIILEEFEEEKTSTQKSLGHYVPLVLSAKSKTSVLAYKNQLVEFLKNNASVTISQLANNLQGKAAFANRICVVVKNIDEFIDELNTVTTDDIQQLNSEISENKKVVFMFPGQGSQYENMAYDLYQENAYFASIINDGLVKLTEITNHNYKNVLFNNIDDTNKSGLINETQYTQPLVFLIEYALAKLLIKSGIEPDMMIGHSLGEYTAACVSGVFSFEDALSLIVERAKLMEATEAGKMISINRTAEDLESYLDESINIAAINTPNSAVLSGSVEAIDKVKQTLQEAGIPSIPLKTSKAFHSCQMDSMLVAFLMKMNSVTLKEPVIPFISNVTGKAITTSEATSPKYWVKHIRNTVQFAKGISQLKDLKYTVFLEVGPGNILTNLYQRNVKNAEDSLVITTLNKTKNIQNDAKWFMQQIGNLWTHGISPKWEMLTNTGIHENIKLPLYAFEKKPFLYKVDVYKELSSVFEFTKKGQKKPFKDWFYTTNWKLSRLEKSRESFLENKTILLFANDDEVSTQLLSTFNAIEKKVIIVKKGEEYKSISESEYMVNPTNNDDLKKLYEAILKTKNEIGQYVYGWTLANSKTAIAEINAEHLDVVHADFYTCLAIIQTFKLQQTQQYHKFTLLTQGHVNIYEQEKTDFASATAITLLYVAMQESVHSFNCVIDIDQKDEHIAAKIANDILYNIKDLHTAYRNNIRWTKMYDPKTIEENKASSRIKENGVYLISGGMGNAAVTLATHLLEKYKAKVILFGRSQIPEKHTWEKYLKMSYQEIKDRKLEKLIRYIKLATKHEESLFYSQGDIAKLEEVQKTVDAIEHKHGTLNGIIHTAGNINRATYELVENIQTKNVNAQFMPKVNGIVNLYEVTKTMNVDFVWSTSSLASILGGLTYGSYAVANSFMDHFITTLNQNSLQKWVSVNLDGLSFGEGKTYIEEEQFINILEITLNSDDDCQWIVSVNDIFERDTLTQRTFGKETEKNELTNSNDGNNSVTIGSIEEELVKLWKDFFDEEEIDLDSNYFELGGNSLNIIVMHQKIKELWNVDIPMANLFNLQTIKDIIKEIKKYLEKDAEKEETIICDDDTFISF